MSNVILMSPRFTFISLSIFACRFLLKSAWLLEYSGQYIGNFDRSNREDVTYHYYINGLGSKIKSYCVII